VSDRYRKVGLRGHLVERKLIGEEQPVTDLVNPLNQPLHEPHGRFGAPHANQCGADSHVIRRAVPLVDDDVARVH
jgi:hypothetical protein